jgi:aromatic amino acid aminotransferase I / 2-aminoadipate transaminase
VSQIDFQVPDIQVGLPDNIVDNWRVSRAPAKSLSAGESIGPASSSLEIPVGLQYELGVGTSELIETLQGLNLRLHPNIPHNCVTLHCGNADGVTKLFRLFLNPGDSLLLEEFSYPGITNSLFALGVRLMPIKMDQFGLIPEDMERTLQNWDEGTQGRRPHLLYLIPYVLCYPFLYYLRNA